MEDNRMVSFSLGGMAFEYDDNKNQINIKKNGISFKSAARIFFDYDRIEFYDEDGIRKKLCAIECKKFLKMLERIAYFRPDIETGLLECYTKFTIIFWRLYYAQN